MAALVTAALVLGGLSVPGAAAQTHDGRATGGSAAQAMPPDTNTFPIAAPAEVSFTDDWHACRGSGCSRRHKGNDLFADGDRRRWPSSRASSPRSTTPTTASAA